MNSLIFVAAVAAFLALAPDSTLVAGGCGSSGGSGGSGGSGCGRATQPAKDPWGNGNVPGKNGNTPNGGSNTKYPGYNTTPDPWGNKQGMTNPGSKTTPDPWGQNPGTKTPPVQGNTGPGYIPGTGPIYNPGTGPVYNPGSGPGYNPGTGPIYNPGTGPGYNPGTGPVYNPGTGPVYNPGTGPGYNPGTGPGYNPGTGPGYHPGTGPGYNPGTGPGYRPGTGPGYNPGSGPGYNPGTGPGYNPGTGSYPGSFTTPDPWGTNTGMTKTPGIQGNTAACGNVQASSNCLLLTQAQSCGGDICQTQKMCNFAETEVASGRYDNKVRSYVQTVLQCITRNVQSRGGNSCPNLNTALGEYLFENKPENNCFYQGEVCSILMNFPDIAINVFYSQTLDPTFRDHVTRVFKRATTYCSD